MRTRTATYLAIGAATLLGGTLTATRAQAPAPLTLDLADYLAAPITGGGPQTTTLARINFLRPEPGTSGRWFIDDLNGPLYIVDPSTKTFTTYLDFNGRDDAPGLFDWLNFAQGFAAGLTTFQFDPDYLTNGRFYTVHQEEPTVPGSLVPTMRPLPGWSEGLRADAAGDDPGPDQPRERDRRWTDTNIRNTTFEGTARELLRIPMNTRIHPVGDPHLQSHRPARRRRLARDVHRLGRRRLGRAARPTSATTRSASTRWSARSCASCPTLAHDEHQHGQRERPLPRAERQPLRQGLRARARSGPTDCVTRIGWTGKSIRSNPRTTD